MSNPTDDKKNIGKYTAIAGAFLAGGAVNAQIQYIDIDPDVNVDINTPFNLDMDGNATDDAMFSVGTFSGSGTYYGGLINYFYSGMGASVAMPNGGVMGSLSSQASLNVASLLNSSDMVTNSANFVADGILAAEVDITVTGYYSGTFTQYPGNFHGQTDKFIGVNFDIGGNTHYGWIRLDVSATGDQVTVKDYAYNQVPDLGIAAGQVAGLNDIDISQKVSFKTMLDGAMINVTPDLLGGTVSIIDLTGKEVSSASIEAVNTHISYNDITSGIYMIAVNAESGSVSKKIYIH